MKLKAVITLVSKYHGDPAKSKDEILKGYMKFVHDQLNSTQLCNSVMSVAVEEDKDGN